MPVRTGKDKRGRWYRWGKRGKKYYGKNAKARARRQGRAIHARKRGGMQKVEAPGLISQWSLWPVVGSTPTRRTRERNSHAQSTRY